MSTLTEPARPASQPCWSNVAVWVLRRLVSSDSMSKGQISNPSFTAVLPPGILWACKQRFQTFIDWNWSSIHLRIACWRLIVSSKTWLFYISLCDGCNVPQPLIQLKFLEMEVPGVDTKSYSVSWVILRFIHLTLDQSWLCENQLAMWRWGS